MGWWGCTSALHEMGKRGEPALTGALAQGPDCSCEPCAAPRRPLRLQAGRHLRCAAGPHLFSGLSESARRAWHHQRWVGGLGSWRPCRAPQVLGRRGRACSGRLAWPGDATGGGRPAHSVHTTPAGRRLPSAPAAVEVPANVTTDMLGQPNAGALHWPRDCKRWEAGLRAAVHAGHAPAWPVLRPQSSTLHTSAPLPTRWALPCTRRAAANFSLVYMPTNTASVALGEAMKCAGRTGDSRGFPAPG